MRNLHLIKDTGTDQLYLVYAKDPLKARIAVAEALMVEDNLTNIVHWTSFVNELSSVHITVWPIGESL